MMRSLSTSALGQPSDTKPTLGAVRVRRGTFAGAAVAAADFGIEAVGDLTVMEALTEVGAHRLARVAAEPYPCVPPSRGGS